MSANCFPTRAERAEQIADQGLIRQDGDAFFVRSSPEGREYRVSRRGDGAPMCSCADAQFNGALCKHLRGLALWIKKNELEKSK